MKNRHFPPGWDEDRVRRVFAHYETQTEEEAVAEDERAFEEAGRAVIEIPIELMPACHPRSDRPIPGESKGLKRRRMAQRKRLRS
jgi:hypothetical protein